MKRGLLALVLAVLMTAMAVAAPKSYSLSSPDGKVVAGISAGALVDIAWLIVHNSRAALYAAENPGLSYNGIFALYEIVPGFIASLVAAIVITLLLLLWH